MSQALALSAAVETKWTVISGPMKGSVRLMHGGAFAIGRSTECEFVIVSDPKCSRRHAQVQWTASGCEIHSLNEDNPMLINGQELPSAILQNGDIVTLGDTEIQFNLTSMAQRYTQISLVEPADAPAYAPPANFPSTPSARAKPSLSHKPKSANPGRLVLYFVLAIIGLWLFTGNEGKKKKILALRTAQEAQADIDTANKLNEVASNQPLKRFNDVANPARQAQENFVRGFRDYRKGQFERSLDSFQACLALDPQHALCNRYLSLAKRRSDEFVQAEIVLGRRYRDQNQFRACRASFRNVMVMVKDANNMIYKEAKANYDACNSLAEGHY